MMTVVGSHNPLCVTQSVTLSHMAMSRKRLRRPSGWNALANIGTALVRKNAMRMSRTYTRTRTDPRTSSAPLTGQYDFKTDYKKKRFGRKKYRRIVRRRRYRKSIVQTVRDANVGTTHIVRRSTGSISTGLGLCERNSYGLNGLNGSIFGDFNSTDDLSAIFKDVDIASWNAAGSSTLPGQNHKLYVKHSTLELTMRNTGTNDALIELYYHYGTKPSADGLSPSTLYDAGFIKQAQASDPNTGNVIGTAQLSAQTVGTTPFQSSLFCKHFKIYKRQKFRIPAANEINVVIHYGKPFTVDMDWAKNHSTDRRWHGILIQQQGSPSQTTIAQATTVTYLATRRYNFKMFRDNLPKDAFDAPV